MADTSLVFNIFARDRTGPVFQRMKGAALVAGAAIGAALAAGAVQAMEKSKLDGVLAAQLGANASQAKELGKTSSELYAAGFGEDLPGVTNAIKTAAQNGLVELDSIGDASSKKLIGKLMTVSQIVGEESQRVSAAVSTMMRNGMAKSAEEAMDLLVKATQNGANKSEDLIDTLEEYPTLFRSLGLDGQQALGLISQGLKGGARNADQVADAIKEFGIRAIDGSKGARDAYKALGLDADKMIQVIARGGPQAAQAMDTVLDKLNDMDDPVKQNAAGVGLFGTKWEDMREAVLSMDLTTASEQMDGLAGATDRASKSIQETSGQKLERFKRSAQMALVDALAAAVPYIEKTFGWLSRNSGWVVPLAAGLAVFGTAIWGIITAMKVWSAVQVVLNLALWTSPVTWIVLAIVALVAVVVLIATKTTWFQTIWNTAWGWIKGAVSGVFSWVRDNWPLLLAILTGPIGLAVLFIVKHWDQIKAGASGVWKWITDKFNSLVGFFKGLPGRIGGVLRSLFTPLGDGAKTAINRVIRAWNSLDFTIGGGSFAGVNIPSVTFGTPNLPYLAKGGVAERSGMAVVGERGPELVHLSRGAQVTPLTGRNAPGGGRTVIELRSDGTEMAELLIRILRLAIKDKGGNVQVVLGGRA